MSLIIDIRPCVGKIHDRWDGKEEGSFTEYLKSQLPNIKDELMLLARIAEIDPSEIKIRFDMPRREARLTAGSNVPVEAYLMLQHLLQQRGIESALIRWGRKQQ